MRLYFLSLAMNFVFAAVRAVERAADRPQRRVAPAVVEQVVLHAHLHEALARQVDLLAVGAVLRKRQRLHLVGRHQRQEVGECGSQKNTGTFVATVNVACPAISTP